jgi:hypothetical protein
LTKCFLFYFGGALAAYAGTLSQYEGFEYTAGSSIEGLSGGFGWSGGWYRPGGLDATITSPGLSNRAFSVTGNAAGTEGNQAPGPASVAFWLRDLAATVGGDGATAYVSFLFRPDAGAGFYGGVNFGVFVGLSGDQSFYGLEGDTGDISLSNVEAEEGVPVSLVLRIDFLAGNDRISLFVNPAAGGIEPAFPDVVKTNVDLLVIPSIGINNFGGFTTDEIRIGDAFDAVTPLAAVPEPSLGVLAGAGLAMLMIKRAR